MALTTTGIRTAIVSLLTGATGAGANVYDSQSHPWQQSGIGISVYTPTTRELRRGKIAHRTDTVKIDAVIQGAASDAILEAALDTLEGQILALLDSTFPTYGLALADGNRLTRSDYSPISRGRPDESGDKLRGMVVIQWDVSYDVDRSPIAVEDWLTTEITLDPIDPEGTDDTAWPTSTIDDMGT